ncbi:MAG: hypothetical protein ING16_10955 [Roseomonas sp.]|nr:hypothetical protein [Roseomonas sp.]
MDNHLLEFFQHEVGLQCKFMLRAANEVNNSRQKNDVEGVFYGLQSILSASANISKALWGQGGKAKRVAERKRLRDSLQMSDDSPLRPTDMRNHFEHFDDRLERWWQTSTHKNYVDMNLGPRNAIHGLAKSDSFRNFDPQSNVLCFGDDEVNIQALIDEAQALLLRIRAGPNPFRV